MGRTTPRVLITSLLAIGCGDDLPAEADTSSTTAAATTTSGSGVDTTSSPGDTGTGTTGDDDIDQFPGLSAPVEILVDDRGIPHIYGQIDLDVMYASGYQMATDRLFQMELMRRRALGRQAEVLGADFVGQDQISRIFDLPRWGAANLERLRGDEPEIYRRLVAWLAGVNARIAEVTSGQAPLPYGFGPEEADFMPEPWTLEEHSAIAKLLMLGNSNSLERELLATIVQRNFPAAWSSIELSRPAFPVSTMPPDELPAPAPWRPSVAHAPKPPIPATPAELVEGMAVLRRALRHVPRVGSNNWAVDGSLTQSGRPIVANDPHQPLESPSLMYAQHLSSAHADGDLDVIGWSFAGTAGIQLGHNRHVQWAATTNFADVMDVWEVELDGGDVRVGDQMVAMDVRSETIMVKGGEPVMLEVRDVPGYGVLLPSDIVPLPIAAPGNALLLNWTGMSATAEERTFTGMTLATSIDEYDAAADLMEVGGFNFVAADGEGITYRVHIQVPDRGDPSARPMPYVVVDGNDPGSLWSGQLLPPQQLPHSRAEGRGFITTANNDPWGFTFDGDVSNDPWYYGYFYASGFRAKRLTDELTRLAAEGGITREDMQALQTDTYATSTELVLPRLEQAWSELDTDPELAPYQGRPALETLVTLLTVDWDRRMERGEPGALAYHLLVLLLTDEVTRDELSILYPTVLGAETPFVIKIPMLALTEQYPESAALLGASPNVVILESLSRAADLLEARYGSVDPAGYAWGDVHGTDFTNPFGGDLYGGWWPSDGGEDTVNVSSSTFLDEAGGVADRFDSHDGAIFRVVTEIAADGTPEAYCNFPPGNSADPASPHFDDTREAWLEDEYTYLPFRRDEVEAATERTIMLEP